MIKNTGILYVRMFVTMLITLYSSRIILKNLGASDYGIYNVVAGVVSMMGFINIVMCSTTNRYISIELGKGSLSNISKVFSASFFIHLGISILTLVLGETLGLYYIYFHLNVPVDKISDAVFVFQVSLFTTVLSILSVPYQAILTAYERFSFVALVNILTSVLTLLIAFLLDQDFFSKLKLYSFLISFVFSVTSLMYYFYVKKQYPNISLIWVKDTVLYKEMAKFSAWIMFGAGASVGKVQVCALFINSFFGSVMNASFAIATQVNNQIVQFSQNINRATIPQITKNYASGDLQRMTDIVCYSSKYSFFMLYILGVPVLLNIDYILSIWLGSPPPSTALLCRLMIITALIESMTSGIPAAVHASGKIKKFQLSISIVLLLVLPVIYILFKMGYPLSSLNYAYIIVSIINVFIGLYLLKKN